MEAIKKINKFNSLKEVFAWDIPITLCIRSNIKKIKLLYLKDEEQARRK